MKKIKLAVVDDQLLFRKGLISLLKEYDEIEVVMEASNGEELLELLKKKRVDLVITDLEMPVMDGIELTEKIREKYPETKILALTMHDEDSFVVHLIEKGANGYLLKDYDIELIIDAVYAVMENGYYFNDRVSKAMVKGLIKSKKVIPSFNTVQLTPREISVVELICKEYTNKDIAAKLFLSPRTIDGHREHILQKTGAKNVAGIVMYAFKNNLVD